MKQLHTTIPILLIFFASIGLYTSCDKLDGPYLKKNNSSGGTCAFTDTAVKPRRILVEDYTGHTCGNCPRAAAEADTMIKKYGDKIVVMAVHCGSFASPGQPGTPFADDFRTDIGTSWDAFFGLSVVGLPQGMINRIGFNTTHQKTYSQWAGMVASVVNKPAEANLFILNSYNSGDRKLDICVKTKFLKDMTSKYSLAVCILEDSIVGAQIDYRLIPNPDVNEHYEFNNMLRGAVTSTDGNGDPVSPSTNGSSVVKSYSITLNEKWVPSHCNVLAFLYDASTQEVVQAEIAKVIP